MSVSDIHVSIKARNGSIVSSYFSSQWGLDIPVISMETNMYWVKIPSNRAHLVSVMKYGGVIYFRGTSMEVIDFDVKAAEHSIPEKE